MFDHVTIRASDRSALERFYRTVLGALGLQPCRDDIEIFGWDDFGIIAADAEHPPTRHLHVAFAAASREQVDTFWEAGVEAGYPDDGAPGERPQYGVGYYGAFLLDPDGNSAEAVHDDNMPPPGQIDHLWIGVRDLATAERFYTVLADHTGFRPDHRWDAGRQFRRGPSTFSVIHDGRPPTESLHLAFPASDRQAVAAFHRAAMQAGYRDNGEPGERPHYHAGYYAAFVLDPDGTNVEMVVDERG